jgi:hypothetical protein
VVDVTVRDFEQAVQDYNIAEATSLLTTDARWIEYSLPRKLDDLEWPALDKLKAAGVRITYRVHDFETHVQGDVAWVTVTTVGTFSADTAEGQKLLLQSLTKEYCSSQETHVSCEITAVESMALVKTPSGWKIALGHSTLLPKAQK